MTQIIDVTLFELSTKTVHVSFCYIQIIQVFSFHKQKQS